MYRVVSCLTNEHDFWLLALAMVVCVVTAGTAFKTFSTALASSDQRRVALAILTGICTGAGIWATHFIAMLAYHGSVSFGFAPGGTLVSLCLSIGLAVCAFGLAAKGGDVRIAGAGVLLGCAIGFMHHAGMEALVVAGTSSFETAYVALGWALGVGLSTAAMMFFARLRGVRAVAAGAGLLSLAVLALHFTAMSAITFTLDPLAADEPVVISRTMLALSIASVTLLVLLSTMSADFIQTANLRGEHALRTQNDNFNDALKYIPVGMSMFDPSRRLIMCNNVYRSMYKLPAELTRPGTSFADIIAYHEKSGEMVSTPEAVASVNSWLEGHFARLAQGKPFRDIQHLEDGRIISVLVGPMAGGGWVDVQEDITEQREREAKISHMAQHDALTDLPNRVLLRHRLEQALQLRRGADGIVVHCLDLDRFKGVNDTLGHPVGDTLLQMVSKRLRASVRDRDTVARLGGDEFVVVQQSGDPLREGTALARRIIDVLSEPYDIDGHLVHVGTSIGIAIAPGDGEDADTLLRHGDMALYRAKASGRGAWCLFEAEMNTSQHARYQIEQDLRQALANDEFELHYQPIVKLKTGTVGGCEALIRWRHPERGLVSPGSFIPVAEETGQIVQIGAWALRQACAEAANWPSSIKVAVNLSPLQCKSPDLCKTVFDALSSSGLEPERLELEITESALLEQSESTLAKLTELHDYGVRVAMDDFGTGYSSLSYLRSFPFDKIKIDRCFITDLDGGAENAVAIIRAIASLGRALDLTVTAEGVETEEQLEKVRAEGCTEIQGYLFSGPKPVSELPALFLKSIATRRRAKRKAVA